MGASEFLAVSWKRTQYSWALLPASMLGSPKASFVSCRVNYLIRYNLRQKRNRFFCQLAPEDQCFPKGLPVLTVRSQIHLTFYRGKLNPGDFFFFHVTFLSPLHSVTSEHQVNTSLSMLLAASQYLTAWQKGKKCVSLLNVSGSKGIEFTAAHTGKHLLHRQTAQGSFLTV